MEERAGDRLDTRVYVCASLTVAVAAAFVALRFYTRWRVVKMIGVEDWLILISWLLSLGSSIGLVIQTELVLGKHIEDVTPEALNQYFQMQWGPALCYNISLIVTKMSILLLYIRVLTYDASRWVAWALFAIVTIFGIFIFASIMTTCVPGDKNYLVGVCLPVNVWWSIAGFNVGSDVLLILFPLPIIFALTLPTRQKIELVIIFALGIFVAVMSILRITLLVQEYVDPDFTYGLVDVSMWSCIEVNGAIVCACLATLKPLWRHVSTKYLSYRNTGEQLDDGSAGSDRPPTVGKVRVRPLQETRSQNASFISEWPPEPKETMADSHEHRKESTE